MRAYDLTLTSASGKILTPSASGFVPSTNGQPTYSSRIANPRGNGGTINNPAALNIEFDIPSAPLAVPQGNVSLKVWGIGLAQISQSTNLNPANGALGAGVTLRAGMAPGLPLATLAAPYYGVIAKGSVFQAFGNWQGVNQTLELVVQPGAGYAPSGGIAFIWRPGQMLSVALNAALFAAFPLVRSNISVAIAPIVQSQSSLECNGIYASVADLADMIQQYTQPIGEAAGFSNYQGVQLAWDTTGKFRIFDGTAPGAPIQILFDTMIGQPTWIDSATINFKTVMRADIQVGDLIQMPTGIASPYALTSAAAAVPGTPASSASAFKGQFVVTEVHHFGNFRQADGDSWCSTFNATSVGSAS